MTHPPPPFLDNRLRAARLDRRDLIRLTGSAAVAALVAGCGGESARTFSWQAIPPYSLQATTPAVADYVRAQLAAYEDSSRYDIEAEVSSADVVAAMAKLLLQASQGRAPDIAQGDSYIFGRMADYARPLGDRMQAAGLRLDDWFPTIQQVMTGGGGDVRGLQFTTDVRVLYRQRELVPDAPATWDDLIAMGKPLAEQGQYVLFPGGRSEGSVTTSLWPQYWAQGVELFDADGGLAFDSGAGYDAMAASLGVVERAVSEGITPQAVANFGSEDDMNADIAAGRVSMFMGGNWQAAALDDIVDDDFFRTWEVSPLPTVGGTTPVTSAGGWLWGAFTDDDAKVAAAVDWVLQAFVGDVGMASWCSIGGYLPPRQSVYDLPDYEQNPFTPVFREHLERYARTRPPATDYQQVSNALQVALSSVASGSTGATEALDQALTAVV